MLAYILAIAVGLGSFSLYMAAFFFPEVYRKYDFVWSGVGMFYALVLWVCAGRITGGVLLGQMASVALLGWLGWQTLGLRRSLTPPTQQTQLPDSAKTLSQVMQNPRNRLRVTLKKQENTPKNLVTDAMIEPLADSMADPGVEITLQDAPEPSKESDAKTG